MNKRIQELALQCNEEVGDYQYGSIPSFNYEKFAGLIVQECVSQCWTVSELEHKGDVVYQCSKRIRKHFGVE